MNETFEIFLLCLFGVFVAMILEEVIPPIIEAIKEWWQQ